MHTISISDEVKALLDSLRADDETETQFVEDAIRLRASAVSGDEGLADAIEAGLDDMRRGRFTLVDNEEAHRALWKRIDEDVERRVAGPR
ncbi:MAG TPA: hypothetical protein VHB27_12425 [Rhodopila sp.]|uniref:hypothetical protein n=1 Tax=Rhodopila sp. TaxID=2480087 RepID=UPI002CF3DF4D|nr:hypothetical protein [Rhodopila sp.]HVY16023.1 hypothetical protein [Rhodopila sp.]